MEHGRRSAAHGRAWLLAAAVALCALPACGGSSVTPQEDAGPVQGTDRLEPMDPVDQGLKFGTSVVLRVVYLDADGNTLAGRRVEFALVGEARGSTLSAASALTDGAGIASVEVRAGQSLTTFEVHTTSANAGAVVFVVSVNERGEFAVLDVRAVMPDGVTVAGELLVRLYDQVDSGMSCATISAFAPPEGGRMKSAAAPDWLVNFGALEPSHDYTLVVIPAGDGVPEVGGCVDLLHDRLVVGSAVLALVPLHRLQIAPAETYLVTSRLLVGSLDGVTDAFAPLACPLSPADVFIDCLVDASTAGPGDPLDCVPTSADEGDLVGVGHALTAYRGRLQNGCRDENIVPGVTSPSLEKYLHDQLVALAPTATQALAQATLPDAVSQALAEVTLGSELFLAPTPSPDRWIATHVLREATWSDAAGTGSFRVDLSTQGLPRISAAGVPVTLSATGELAIGAHDLSLRFGRLTREAAGSLLFARYGLPADSAGLVAVFTGALMSGHSSACEALDLLLCPAAGKPAGCLAALASSCADALAALPAALDARLLAFDGGADLELEGAAHATGMSGPVAEFLSGGQWTVGLGRAGSRSSFLAAFAGTPEPAGRHLTSGQATTGGGQ
jgi:hypothetical protein